MKKKNIAVLGIAVAMSLSLMGCGDKEVKPLETQPPIEAIQPTSAVEVENQTEPSTEKSETLVIGEAELPVMIVPGENGQAVVISGDTDLEEIEDEVAKRNIDIMLGKASEDNADSSENISLEEIPSYPEETLSAEQMQRIEDSVKEYTDKQAEDWLREVEEANRERE